jgi:hypothetical protein
MLWAMIDVLARQALISADAGIPSIRETTFLASAGCLSHEVATLRT